MATSNDRVFLFRLQMLIFDGGTDVLRNIFDQKLQNVPLNVFLENETTSINRLRGRIITNAQYGQLFPPIPQIPNSAAFDTTLLICLLRNLQSFGLNQNYSWNVVPQPTDTSVEADLCRLKGFRNEVAHIPSLTGFNNTTFQSKWTNIEQVLLRLNTAVPNSLPDLQQTLDSYKHSPLDPIAEQKIQADIKRWQEMEKALEKEIQLIKTDVIKNVIKVNELDKEVKEVTGRVEVLTKDVNDANNDVKEVTIKVKESIENVEKVTLDIKNVTDEITELHEDVGEVQNDVKTMTEGFHLLTGDLSEVKQYVEQVQGHVKEVNNDVAEVKGDVQKVTEDVRKVEKLLTNQNETKETDKTKGKAFSIPVAMSGFKS